MLQQQDHEYGQRRQRHPGQETLAPRHAGQMGKGGDAGGLGQQACKHDGDGQPDPGRNLFPVERRSREHEQQDCEQFAQRAEIALGLAEGHAPVARHQPKGERGHHRRQPAGIGNGHQQDHGNRKGDRGVMARVADRAQQGRHHQPEHRAGQGRDRQQHQAVPERVAQVFEGAENPEADHGIEGEHGQHAVLRRQMQHALGDLPRAALLVDHAHHSGRGGGHGQRGQHQRGELGRAEGHRDEVDGDEGGDRFDQAAHAYPRVVAQPAQIDAVAELEQDQAKGDVGQHGNGAGIGHRQHAKLRRAEGEADQAIEADAREVGVALAEFPGDPGNGNRHGPRKVVQDRQQLGHAISRK